MSTLENPYVAIVARKHRNLKKKLEKILKLELNIANGKTLDEEQLILYSSKSSVEKAIADIGGLKEQLEEVYVQECASAESAKIAAATSVNASEAATETHVIELSSAATQCEEKPKVEVAEVASQMEQPVVSPPAAVAAVDTQSLEAAVKKILKVFHVCLKYSSITGNALPPNVDFFGKTLLGQTSIAGFDVALEGSLRVLGVYLNDELAAQSEFVRGFTYSQIADFVDGLAFQMGAPVDVANTFASLSVSPPPVNTAAVMAVVDSPVQLEEEEVGQEEQYVEELVQEEEEEEQQHVAAPASAPVAVAPVARQQHQAVGREGGDRERKQRTPRERLPPPRESAAGAPVEGTSGEKTRAPRNRVRKPRGDEDASPAAAAGENSDARPRAPRPARDAGSSDNAGVTAAGAVDGTDEKRKRAPRAARKPRVEGESSAGAASSAEGAKAEPSTGGRVWGGDNRIKDVHSSSAAATPAERRISSKPLASVFKVDGPAPTPAADSSSGPRPKPVVKNVAGTSSSGSRPPRRDFAEGGERPPRTRPDGSSAPRGPPRDARPSTSGAPRGPPRDPRPAGSGTATSTRPTGDRPPAAAARPPRQHSAPKPVSA